MALRQTQASAHLPILHGESLNATRPPSGGPRVPKGATSDCYVFFWWRLSTSERFYLGVDRFRQTWQNGPKGSFVWMAASRMLFEWVMVQLWQNNSTLACLKETFCALMLSSDDGCDVTVEPHQRIWTLRSRPFCVFVWFCFALLFSLPLIAKGQRGVPQEWPLWKRDIPHIASRSNRSFQLKGSRFCSCCVAGLFFWLRFSGR